MSFLTTALDYLQTHHPKLVAATHWLNAGFTLGNFTLDTDLTIKVLAFLFVTVPLGIVQWWNLVEKWKERRLKKHGQRANL